MCWLCCCGGVEGLVAPLTFRRFMSGDRLQKICSISASMLGDSVRVSRPSSEEEASSTSTSTSSSSPLPLPKSSSSSSSLLFLFCPSIVDECTLTWVAPAAATGRDSADAAVAMHW